ncbi:hypothetical protein Lal_00020117 [Lupinus albus]|nr:hypothetical protein Lal_00020117 [Lupinus albus]
MTEHIITPIERQEKRHTIKLTGWNDAVSVNWVRISIGTFSKPSFDPWPTNSLLELSILPLLPVPHNPSYSIRRHSHTVIPSLRHRHLAVYLRHRILIRHHPYLYRR